MFVEILIFCGVLFGAYMVGVWGFCQIIGSLQNIKHQPKHFITMLIWLVILAAVAYLVLRFIPDYKTALIIGYAGSLLSSFSAGKIE